MRSWSGMSIAWMHAASNRLFRPPDERRVHSLEEKVRQTFADADLADDCARDRLITALALEVAREFQVDPETLRFEMIRRLVRSLLDCDKLFELPTIDWTEKQPISELWNYEKELKRQEPCSTVLRPIDI